MILQALYDYYNRRADLAPYGYERKEIPFIIVIDEGGRFVNLEDTREGDGANRRAMTFLVIKNLHTTGKNAWQTTNVFWDHFGYVLAHPREQQGEKTEEQLKQDARNQHGSFLRKVHELVDRFPDNKQFEAVKLFYDTKEQLEVVKSHPNWKECIRIPGCNLSFRLVGDQRIIAEHPDLERFLSVDSDEDLNEPDNAHKDGICLITGKRGPIAILHTPTPIPGGKSTGKIVGFQKNSGYDSYYKEQGTNAPISKHAESSYTTALNVLLGKDSHNKFRLSDTTVVFWAAKQTRFENTFSFFFSSSPKDDPDRNSREVKALYNSVQTGKLQDEGDTAFYILGLAPNSARISVRFWHTGTVKDFAGRILQHFTDLEIVHSRNDTREYFSLFNLLTNIAFDFKLENIAPNLPGKVIESILKGTRYPATLQQQCLRRIRADVAEKTNVTRIRAAILKAYLNRKLRTNIINEKQITMALDSENTNQGYLCGRLFAVLEKIQEDAQPGINATIKDRYYGAASTTPVTVFGRLLGLSNHHMGKLNQGKKTYYEKIIQQIMAGVVSSGMPIHLSLDDQSRFAIGYYHQRQDLFTRKDIINANQNQEEVNL